MLEGEGLSLRPAVVQGEIGNSGRDFSAGADDDRRIDGLSGGDEPSGPAQWDGATWDDATWER